jgi:FecR protein
MPASIPSRSLHTLWAAAALLLLAAPAAADRDGSYGYFRVIEGSATVTQAGSGTRAAAELNQPVLAGDRLWVPRNGRLEVVLSDGNLLRVDGDTELLFERLADSPDSDDRQTVLRLLDGNIQLVVWRGSGEPPRIDTPNATVYVQDEGRYRIGTGDEEWTEVVVREGYAEVVTERGSAVVREDEQAWVDGVRDPRVDVDDADARDGLERWAERLDDEYESDGDRYAYLDPDLRYQGSSLHRYGSWVNYNHSWVWRPRVALGWRPYHLGRWAYTPAGYFWITSEPWGWVPYHYGTWDYVPAYGWLWYPGRTFAPAWVYWYWGSSHIGWCPVGYYTHWYNRGWGGGFRWGTYGWVSGHWGLYDDWNFVAYDHFRRRDLHRWARGGRDLRETRPGGLGRGILTTDTRSLTPDRLGNPRDVQEVLRRRDVTPRGAGGDLPDVTPFIERRNELPPEVMRRVAVERPGDAPEGSPMRPRIAIDRRGGGAAGATDGRRAVGGDSPRAVPARPDSPATDGGGEAWRVRPRDRGEGGASDAPRAVPARPARPPESDTAPEAWRVRRRDGGESGASDAPRAVPERRTNPPESDGGEARRAVPEERRTPPPPESDSGRDESWRVRERDDSGSSDRGRSSDGEARESRPRAADREPPARSYRSMTQPRQARPESDAGREIRRAPRRDESIRSAPPSRPAPEVRSRPSYRPSSPPPSRSGSYSAPPSRPSAPRASSPPSSSGSGRSAAPRARGSDSPPSSRQPRSRSRGDGDD